MPLAEVSGQALHVMHDKLVSRSLLSSLSPPCLFTSQGILVTDPIALKAEPVMLRWQPAGSLLSVGLKNGEWEEEGEERAVTPTSLSLPCHSHFSLDVLPCRLPGLCARA